MSSKHQSPRQSLNASPLPEPKPTKSIVASKVPTNADANVIIRDLRHNYLGVEQVTRLHDKDGKVSARVRIDFTSIKLANAALSKGYVLIDGKQCPVQTYQPPFCYRCRTEGHYASNCSQKPLTEQRLQDLFQQQQQQLESMMNAFESKWNERLSSVKTSSPTNVNLDKVIPVLKDLTSICQQFNQQNVQMQQKFSSVINHLQDLNLQASVEQTRVPFPEQNGH
ncbi:unnamed protein product [Adineta ricciae]|uniref:CCHC-type domain-containing protein n=1 Tax=Adineta ricciae TaxID=249248 RepID=A0A815TD10_ADIRI|nr:unnamed protein product [Adineta ricciae]CAF1552164.1 unnamed protein product [Adineta ricciae]